MMPVVMKPEPREQILSSQPAPPLITTASVPVAAPPSECPPQPQTSDGGGRDLQADIEGRIDAESIKGVFGWATVDGVNIPYIIRKYKKFVSVRIVEKKLLSRYPNAFPDELAKKDPLVSFFVTEYEAKLLDEINTSHCGYEYGTQAFSTKDLIVDLVEFEDFYNLVKKTFPEDVLAKLRSTDQPSETSVPGSSISRDVLERMCSWIQINNTVTPVIRRNEFTFVPLSVIKYAAGLLTNVQLEGIQPSPDDCALLNETCKIAGFDFQFGKSTKLIELNEIARHCQPTILQLPFDDPLKHARYLDTPSPSAQPPPTSPSLNPLASSPPGQNNITNPQVQHQFPYQRPPNVPINPFTMMQMMTRSLVPQQLAYSQPGVMPNAMANSAMMPRMPYNPQRPPSGGKPSHPSQHHHQMNPGKPPPYSHGYNPSVHQSNHTSNARMNFSPEPVHMQKGPPVSHLPQYPRHAMPDMFPPNQGYPYPGHSPRGLPPTPPYQPPMTTGGRTGINSNAGNNGPKSSTSNQGSVPSAAATVAAVRSPPKQVADKTSKPTTQPSSSAITNKSNSSNNHLKIEGVVLNGKSISCLNLNSPGRLGKFCLVEAVCKLYFSQININEFLYVLENVLSVPLYSCKDDEEKAFITYYNLPVTVLKCNKMVHLSDLDNFFPQMTYIINQKFSNSALSSSNKKDSNDGQSEKQSGESDRVAISRKRQSSGQGGPESKQSCHLEKILHRLKTSQSSDDNSSNLTQGTSQ